ncbi:MAG TPA: hypothetical protein HA254_05475 [Candidatus Diapherotrites archaeon]|uniref:Cation/H+ exchanger transmembrane domain-containing protein n=1 Tax=Candidatus Iainarchaeum sp. TaxID=3101447 RepID=A0A7J4IXG0_9ARCH|nr:hypothetical protein [Candidatus Diapherotrites archaeon]
MPISIETAFLILGGIIVIGYFGELFAKRFMVPSALLLLAIGYGLKLSGYVDANDFIGLQGLVGTLALVVLLFDGGMSLNVFDVLFKSGRVLAVALFIMLISIVGSALLFAAFGMSWLVGAVFGAIVGGIDAGITISIERGVSHPEKVRNFLTLESSISDVLSIVLAIVLTQALITGAVDLQLISQGIAGKFSVGIFIGLLAGVASILALSKIEKGYNYMVTFALVLLLYSVAEFLSGSGAIAVLAFGLVLGNEAVVRRIMHSMDVESYPVIAQFQSEISFFIRTFFFVFLGIVVTLGNLVNFAIALVLMIMLCIIRYFVVYFSTKGSEYFEHKSVLAAMNPRGLATAVLASYPLLAVQGALGAQSGPAVAALALQLSSFSEIAFYLILLSILFTTVMIPLTNRKSGLDIYEKSEVKQMQV